MRYYIIAGEASGDLHGSNLMRGIYEKDPKAIIRFWGGDLMNGVFVEHQKCVPQDKEHPAGISTETRPATEGDQKVFCSPSFGLPNPRRLTSATPIRGISRPRRGPFGTFGSAPPSWTVSRRSGVSARRRRISTRSNLSVVRI